MIFARADLVKVRPGFIMPACDVGEQRQTKVEIRRFVLTFVLSQPFFRLIYCVFTYEKGGGRESNPRIAFLQPPPLPLGYPAVFRSETVVSPMKSTVSEHPSL